jgi:hypothetical protein
MNVAFKAMEAIDGQVDDVEIHRRPAPGENGNDDVAARTVLFRQIRQPGAEHLHQKSG